MQNYLDQLAKLNELLAPSPFDLWASLGATVMFVITIAILAAGFVLMFASVLSDKLPNIVARVLCVVVGFAMCVFALKISPLNGTPPEESERIVHNTLMDMNEVDYKTLVEGAYRYELDKKDNTKYKELINIIKKASKRRPVQ